MALARRLRAEPDHIDRGAGLGVPPRAPARIQLPPRRGAGLFFRVNVKAIGVVPKAELAVHEPTGATPDPVSRRTVWFDNAPHDTPVFRRDDLPCGFSFKGPAIVEQVDSTVVVPPGSLAEVDKYLNIIIA